MYALESSWEWEAWETPPIVIDEGAEPEASLLLFALLFTVFFWSLVNRPLLFYAYVAILPGTRQSFLGAI